MLWEKEDNMKKLIRKNSKGQLKYDIQANEFCIEFGTVQFNLPMDDYLIFEKELKEISKDLSFYQQNDNIKISVVNKGFTLVMSQEELLSLCDILGVKSKKSVSFKMKIKYSMN